MVSQTAQLRRRSPSLVWGCVLAMILTASEAAAPNHFTQADGVADSRTPDQSDDPYEGSWANDTFERDVAGPISTTRTGGLAKGAAQLEHLLQQSGEDSAERARLLFAFALALPPIGIDYDDTLPWLRRAINEGRAGFPTDSRRFAMILSGYAETEVLAFGDNASDEALRAAREALEIRRRILGLSHVETMVASVTVGEIEGSVRRTAKDPKKVSAAAAYFEPLTVMSPPDDPEDGGVDHMFLAWIRMLVINDQPEAACRVLDRLPSIRRKLGLNLPFIGHQTSRAMREAGHRAQADVLDRSNPLSTGLGSISELQARLQRSEARESGSASWCAA